MDESEIALLELMAAVGHCNDCGIKGTVTPFWDGLREKPIIIIIVEGVGFRDGRLLEIKGNYPPGYPIPAG